jgi:hypothetical protein
MVNITVVCHVSNNSFDNLCSSLFLQISVKQLSELRDLHTNISISSVTFTFYTETVRHCFISFIQILIFLRYVFMNVPVIIYILR